MISSSKSGRGKYLPQQIHLYRAYGTVFKVVLKATG